MTTTAQTQLVKVYEAKLEQRIAELEAELTAVRGELSKLSNPFIDPVKAAFYGPVKTTGGKEYKSLFGWQPKK